MRLADDARLAALVSGIGDVFYIVDRDWRIVVANGISESYFRQPLAQVLGRSLWDVFPDYEASPFTAVLRRAMAEGVSGWLTRASRLQPGHFHECRVAPLGDEGLTVCIVDITERRLAETELRESRERLDLAVGAHGIGIFDADMRTGRATWSAELEAIFGLPPGGFAGHDEDFTRRVVPEDLATLKAATEAAVAEGREVVNLEFRIIRADGAVRWIDSAARLMFDADGELVRIVGTNIDITAQKSVEQHQRLLINELNHRVKNTLAIVQAIARQSFRTDTADPQVRAVFEGRLMALAAAHDVLTEAKWEGGPVARIVAGAVASHDPGGGRITAQGAPVTLGPRTSVALALAMHELATNAVKYGALSVAEGRVDVVWALDQDILSLTWTESGGPAVTPSVRTGFGMRLLTQGLADELGGTVELDLRSEGLVCRMEARLS